MEKFGADAADVWGTIYTICVSLRADNRSWVRCSVDVSLVLLLILMLMLLMLLFMLLMLMLKMLMLMLMSFLADDHYVCSSVAGSLCSRRCTTGPLWDYVNVRLLLGQDFEPVSSRIGLFTICTRISICIAVGPFQLATPLQTALSAIKEIPQL